jgi:hypothetical protein
LFPDDDHSESLSIANVSPDRAPFAARCVRARASTTCRARSSATRSTSACGSAAPATCASRSGHPAVVDDGEHIVAGAIARVMTTIEHKSGMLHARPHVRRVGRRTSEIGRPLHLGPALTSLREASFVNPEVAPAVRQVVEDRFAAGTHPSLDMLLARSA